MAKGNYPQTQLDSMEQTAVQEMVSSLKELYDKGKPTSDEEIKQRIDDYFNFCQCSSIRPGVESLALSLHVSRTTIFNWANGINCSKACQEYIQTAKAFISAYIEQAMLSGKISPPSGIFLAKNWLGYKDTLSIEENLPKEENKRVLTVQELSQQMGLVWDEEKGEYISRYDGR